MQRIRQLIQGANGWQRLWLVLTSLWLFGTVAIISFDFPTHAKSLELLLLRADEILFSVLGIEDPQRIKAQCDRKFPFAMPDTQTMVEYVGCLKENRYEAVQRMYREQRAQLQRRMERQIDETLPLEQLKAVGKGLLLWLVPAFALYGLGLAVAWVRRGFQRDV